MLGNRFAQQEKPDVLHRQLPTIVGTRQTPDPIFASALQQAIGGVEGEIRVALQYMFQAFGARGPSRSMELEGEAPTLAKPLPEPAPQSEQL